MERILFFVDIANMNGAAITLGDLLDLLPLNINSTGELAEAITNQLGDQLVVKDGYVARRDRTALIGSTKSSVNESNRKIQDTKIFVESNPKLFSDAVIVAVSGSASYGSANSDDDVDVFLVTRSGVLWKTLFRILLYIRAKRVLRLDGGFLSKLCFSIAFTVDGFEELLKTRSDPLTARELVALKPIKGGTTLNWYLSSAGWIRSYYPRFSPRRTNTAPPTEHRHSVSEALVGRLVGSYLEFVARIRNHLFKLQGSYDSMFKVVRGKNMLIYESLRYVELRRRYVWAFDGVLTETPDARRPKHDA